MRLPEAYARIWQHKLDGAAPPESQHIDRVRWTAELFSRDAAGPLLDVGCGSGAMLAEARRRGWECVGLDRDPAVVAWLQSHCYDAREADLDSESPTLGTFRIVTMCDVIEHLLDPGAALRWVRSVMQPKGLIYVATPNCAHWRRVCSLAAGQMFRTSGDPVLRDGGHVAYFAPLDLKATLTDTGFTCVVPYYRSHDPAPPDKRRLLLALGARDDWIDYTYLIAVAEAA